MKKRFLIILAALLLLMTSFTACLKDDDDNDDGETEPEDNGGGTVVSVPSVSNTAPDMNADGVIFTNYGTYYSVTGYQAPSGASSVNLVIPATYKDLPVKSIGHRAFTPSAIETNTVIKSITLPEGITDIEASAFADCKNMTSVTIPSTVISIGRNAFARCSSLVSITIPASVTTIGDSIFESCSNLESITVAPENPNYSSLDGDLYSKDGTVLIRYAIGKGGSIYTVPSTVTTLASGSLQASTFTEVTLPANVIRIEPTAFKDCKTLSKVSCTVNTGWWYSSYSDATSGTSIDKSKVIGSPTTFATNLKDSYLRYYINRTV